MNHLGIDLSKQYFDATLQTESGEQVYGRFENNRQGFAELDKWLVSQSVSELHACMEATNIYWEELADYLYSKGYRVSVVNPARIKGFGMSQLQRNKTDKVDSKVIVAFCAALSPKPWQPPTAAQRKLRSLVRHRDALVKTRTQQKNRLADCRDEDVRLSLQTLLATLESEIERIEQQIADLIQQDPDLREQKRLLSSIKGIGEVAAHVIMAEMYDLADYEDAHAAAADAGVNPAHYESGHTIRRKPRMSKVGKTAVRRALYMPALAAIRSNPVIIALAQKMQQQKKHKLVIIGAAMRKLIHIAYGVLKNRTPFDPQWAVDARAST